MDIKGVRKFAAVTFVVVSLVVCAAQTGTVQGQSLIAASSAVNGRIAFASNRDGNYEIYVMNADGSGVLNLTNNQNWDGEPCWSPDGKKIAFVSNRDGNDEIYVMNTDGTGQTRLTYKVDGYVWSPSWSPSGKRIAFASCCSNNGIYAMNADGTGVTRLASWQGGTFDLGTSWSPDDSNVLFVSSDGGAGGYEIYIVNIGDLGVTNLTNSSSLDCDPSWSSGGGRIVFTSDRSGAAEIYVMNTDGSGVKRLTSLGDFSRYPSWSSDVQRVVFSSAGNSGKFQLYVMNADGSGIVRLTNTSASDLMPDWGPRGVVPTPTATSSPTPTLTPMPTQTPRPTSMPDGGDIRLPVPVPTLRQDDSRWATDIYNLYTEPGLHNENTLSSLGCATTSAAMVLSYYSGSEVSPKDLDDWLAANSGYTPEHGIIWTRIPWFAWDKMGLTLAQPVYTATTLSRLDSALALGNPPIVNVCWKDCDDAKNAKWHWVVVVGKSGSAEYLINDPSGWLNRQTLGQYPVWGNMLTYASASGPTAPSVWLYLCSPAELLVTDSLGRRVGVNPISGSEFSEIPGAFYSEEFLSPADDSLGTTMHTKVLVLPEAGTYSVEVIGTGSGSYTLLAISGSTGEPLSQSITRSVSSGQVNKYVLDYSPADGSLELTQSTFIPLVVR